MVLVIDDKLRKESFKRVQNPDVQVENEVQPDVRVRVVGMQAIQSVLSLIHI